MKILILLFVFLSLILGIINRIRGTAGRKDKNRVRPLLIGGMILCSFAILALLASYYFSGKEADLYKISFPAMLLFMFVEHYRRTGLT